MPLDEVDKEILERLDRADYGSFPPRLQRLVDDYHAQLYSRRAVVEALRDELEGPALEAFDAIVAGGALRHFALCCSRRAGKTFMLTRALVAVAHLKPETITTYLGITRIAARDLIWGQLKLCALDLQSRGLLEVEISEANLEVKLGNGSRIWVRGAENEGEIRKLLGHAYSLVIVDEAHVWGPWMDRMLDEFLGPALTDYRGTLVLSGVPGPAHVGRFWNVCRLDGQALQGWRVFRWTVRDNRRFPRWWSKATGTAPDWQAQCQAMLAEERAAHSWDETSPAYLREWCGIWATDAGGLVYAYLVERNGWDGILPDAQGWRYVIGVDFGLVDAFAVVVLAFHQDSPHLWVIEEHAASGQDITACAEIVKGYQEKYRKGLVSTVGDTGALGAQIALEMGNRHGVYIEAAQKSDKPSAIAVLNADFRRGWVFVRKNGRLAAQYQTLPWAPNKAGILEDQRYPNDLCDATLYAYREASNYLWRPNPPAPQPGTREHAQETAKKLREQLAAKNRPKRKRWARRLDRVAARRHPGRIGGGTCIAGCSSCSRCPRTRSTAPSAGAWTWSSRPRTRSSTTRTCRSRPWGRSRPTCCATAQTPSP